MKKDNRVRNQLSWTSLSAAIQIGLASLSFGRHLVKFPQQTGIWFAYLTDWKMIAHVLDGVSKIYKVTQALTIEPDDELGEFKTIGELFEGEEEALMPSDDEVEASLIKKKLQILQAPGLEIIDLNLVLTVNFLYMALDRSGDAITWVLHTLDLSLLAIDLISDKQVLSAPKLKDRFVSDHLANFLILAAYAAFYGVYQGVLGMGDEYGNPPYAVLDWHEKPESTAIYSTVLPLAMPIINGILIKLLEMAQRKLHPDHEVKDYRGKITKKITSCASSLSSYIWPKNRSTESEPPGSGLSLNYSQLN